jgi:hypothetical protein
MESVGMMIIPYIWEKGGFNNLEKYESSWEG